jgi:hypothetical protein
VAFPIPDPTNAVAVATNFATVTTNLVIYATNSITVVTTNFVSSDITGLEVVNKVNGLYSSVFNHFLVMMAIMGAVVGGVIPVLLERKQRREGRLQQKQMDEKFKLQLEKAQKNTDEKITKLDTEKQAIEKSLKETEGRIEKKLASLKGLIAHTDAITSFKEKNFPNALKSGVTAARSYLSGEEKINSQRILNLIIRCLEKLTKAQVQETELAERLSKLNEDLKTMGAHIQPEQVKRFNEALEAALNRTSTT